MITSNLPVLLAERRLRVADLVRMTGISKSTLHRIFNNETTRIEFDTLEKICDVLQVTPNDVLLYTPKQDQASSLED